MNALADALRALLTPDPHSGLRPSIGSPKIADARAALAAHDAAVNAGGWWIVSGVPVHIADADGVHVAKPLANTAMPVEVYRANAERIVACVNACAGIADPAAFIAAAREAGHAD